MIFVLLIIGVALGLFTFRIGSQAGWHWGASLACAAIPVLFVFFMGILGVIIGAMFVAAVWKAN